MFWNKGEPATTKYSLRHRSNHLTETIRLFPNRPSTQMQGVYLPSTILAIPNIENAADFIFGYFGPFGLPEGSNVVHNIL